MLQRGGSATWRSPGLHLVFRHRLSFHAGMSAKASSELKRLREGLRSVLTDLDELFRGYPSWRTAASKTAQRGGDIGVLRAEGREAILLRKALQDLTTQSGSDWWRQWLQVIREQMAQDLHTVGMRAAERQRAGQETETSWRELRELSFALADLEALLSVDDIDAAGQREWLGQLLALFRRMNTALWQRVAFGARLDNGSLKILRAFGKVVVMLVAGETATSGIGDMVLRNRAVLVRKGFHDEDFALLLSRSEAVEYTMSVLREELSMYWKRRREGKLSKALQHARSAGGMAWFYLAAPALFGVPTNLGFRAADEEAAANTAVDFLRKTKGEKAFDEKQFLSEVLKAMGAPRPSRNILGFLTRRGGARSGKKVAPK